MMSLMLSFKDFVDFDIDPILKPMPNRICLHTTRQGKILSRYLTPDTKESSMLFQTFINKQIMHSNLLNCHQSPCSRLIGLLDANQIQYFILFPTIVKYKPQQANLCHFHTLFIRAILSYSKKNIYAVNR